MADVRAIAQRGLQESQKFHVFYRTTKNLESARETVAEIGRQTDLSTLSSLTRGVESADNEVGLKQHQDLLAKVSRDTAFVSAAPLVGLAGLALTFTEALPYAERESARDQVAREVARAQDNREFLNQIVAAPSLSATDKLEYFTTGPEESDDFVVKLLERQMGELPQEQRSLLKAFEGAGVGRVSLLAGSRGSTSLARRAAEVIRLEPGNTQLEGVVQGWLEDKFRSSERLRESDAYFQEVGVNLDHRLETVEFEERHQKLSPHKRYREIWKLVKSKLKGDQLTGAAEKLWGRIEKSMTDEGSVACRAIAKNLGRPELALDAFFYKNDPPETVPEVADFTDRLIGKLPQEERFSAVGSAAAGLRPMLKDQASLEMLWMLEQMSSWEPSKPSYFWSAAREGMAYLSKSKPDLADQVVRMIDRCETRRDEVKVGSLALESYQRLQPGRANHWNTIAAVDQALELGDQADRVRVLRSAIKAMIKKPQADLMTVFSTLRSSKNDHRINDPVLRIFTGADRSGGTVRSYRARLAHDLLHQPLESASSRHEAAYQAWTKGFKSEELRELGEATLAAGYQLRSYQRDYVWVLDRGLELSGDYLRSRGRAGEACCLELAGELCGGLESKKLDATKTLVTAVSKNERFGPATLAKAGKDIWHSLRAPEKDSFGEALIAALEKAAEAVGDEEYLPQKLEEFHRQASQPEGKPGERLAKFLHQVAEMDDEAYWMTLDRPDELEVEFRENEIVIGDVNLTTG